MPNRPKFKPIDGSICAPEGFQAGAVFCGIKTLGTGKGSDKGAKPDLALIVSDVPATVAGLFTTNKVCAAPVKLSAKVAAGGSARAVVVNSGNANACTGAQGMRDAKAMARFTAEAVAKSSQSGADNPVCTAEKTQTRLSASRQFSHNEILVCSTGRIGVPMPMKNVERGIRDCARRLARSDLHARNVAEAIMTSDTRRKEIAVELRIGGKRVRIGGICKGAGMIQPRMAADVVATALRRRAGAPGRSGSAGMHATMLAFITSDAAISPAILRLALTEAVENSFNRITVDGDMSTNDSVIALANGLAGNRPIRTRDAAYKSFTGALRFVCLQLAHMIVRDGEGVSRFVTVNVRNARNQKDAELAARAIASSSLVRTSWCGGDPNWGRILCAVGYSGAGMDETRTDIGYSASGQTKVLFGFRSGRPTDTSFQDLASITAAPEFEVHVDLHQGRADFEMYASDLTEEYVTFNKGDVNDPASLGG
jgi:glutamate N-acetyltransferase/amino-acid N-acetyltransferase